MLRLMSVSASVLFFAIATAKGAFNLQMLNPCCERGRDFYTDNQHCIGMQTPIEGVQDSDQEVCQLIRGVCCRRNIEHKICDAGIELAESQNQCLVPQNQEGSLIRKECCDCCLLGRVLSESAGLSCEPLHIGGLCDYSYKKCCQRATNKTSGESGATNRCLKNNPCAHKCRDLGDAVQCSCDAGYKLATDGFSCIDLDECSEEIDRCDRDTEICVNTIGTYECRSVGSGRPCGVGYSVDAFTGGCEDINECVLGAHDCDLSTHVCFNTPGSFNCVPLDDTSGGRENVCPLGFEFADGSCRDIDECQRGLHKCDRRHERCYNFPGKYECHTITESSCTYGYKYDPHVRACVDMDECQEGLHRCRETDRVCINKLGSYDCVDPSIAERSCTRGFTYSHSARSCIDIDECVGDHDCDITEQCINTVGSYSCRLITAGPDGGLEGGSLHVCPAGYTFNPRQRLCEDINECALGIASCPFGQRCDNTIGSFSCTRELNCGTGYTFDGTLRICKDDDECVLGTHNCGPAYDCQNTRGSFRCVIKTCPSGLMINLQNGVCEEIRCSAGYRADSQGNCHDINECETNEHSCHRNQRCHNTIGSFICRNLLNCGVGYELNDEKSQCIDIDECLVGTHECRGGQKCQNRPGGYICQCETGYVFNSIIKKCEDINECDRFGSQICSRTADCINTPGSYRCDCHEGFKSDETGKICRDINECEEQPNHCTQNCLNTWGSYQCHCTSGYELSDDGRTCEDVDECSVWSGRGSLCIGYCQNTPGSYTCTCPSGYLLKADGRTCQDVNECDGNPCVGDQICLNTRGSHKCITIECPTNYVKDPEQNNRCQRESIICHQGDLQCINAPLAISYNHLAFQSKMHIRAGGLDFFTMRGALWTTTTLQFELELISARVPQGLDEATIDSFRVKRVGSNQAIVALMEPLTGPQEIELELKMKIFTSGQYAGLAVAKIFISVSPYEF